MDHTVQHVFLVGAKSLGAYGGYETFIDKLTEYHLENDRIQYHIACKANGEGSMDEANLRGVSDVRLDKRGRSVEFRYHNARCFKIPVPNIGAAQAIYYDITALQECCRYIQKNQIKNPVVYIMACRIGPFMRYFHRKINRLGGKVYLNPDGHEWMRAKWSAPVRKYWKISERLMVKYSDLVVCDSLNIEKYIQSRYAGKGKDHKTPATTYIAYGAETRNSLLADDDARFLQWLKEKCLEANEYYLVVGRFVPENNYETMIREYMQSGTTKKLAIISNGNEKFGIQLEEKLHYYADGRICFVGTVYDQELLLKIRENAFAYLHGHEVGGTNPSLLEALGSTKLNLLLNVSFNREVAEDAALYWTKEPGELASLIDNCAKMSAEEREVFGQRAKERISGYYSWQFIADQYEKVFCRNWDEDVN